MSNKYKKIVRLKVPLCIIKTCKKLGFEVTFARELESTGFSAYLTIPYTNLIVTGYYDVPFSVKNQ